MIDSGVGVFVPSYRRGERKSITQEYLPFAKLVVSESEAAQYEQSGNDIVVCPDEVQGNLCRVRNWILDQNKKARGVLILDDDYSGIFRWIGKERNFKKLSFFEVEEFIEHGFALAEQVGAFMWGINCVVDKGAYRENTPFCMVRYLGGPFQAFRPNPLRYDESLSLKEDYDMTMQQLSRFRVALRFNMYCYQVKQNEQKGGCATYRNIKREQAQFKALQDKWGSDFIRVDDGNDKNSIRTRREKSYDLNPRLFSPIQGV